MGQLCQACSKPVPDNPQYRYCPTCAGVGETHPATAEQAKYEAELTAAQNEAAALAAIPVNAEAKARGIEPDVPLSEQQAQDEALMARVYGKADTAKRRKDQEREREAQARETREGQTRETREPTLQNHAARPTVGHEATGKGDPGATRAGEGKAERDKDAAERGAPPVAGGPRRPDDDAPSRR